MSSIKDRARAKVALMLEAGAGKSRPHQPTTHMPAGHRPNAMTSRAIHALATAPEWDRGVAFDVVTKSITFVKPPPWHRGQYFTLHDAGRRELSRTAAWLREHGVDTLPSGTVRRAMTALARKQLVRCERDDRGQPWWIAARFAS